MLGRVGGLANSSPHHVPNKASAIAKLMKRLITMILERFCGHSRTTSRRFLRKRWKRTFSSRDLEALINCCGAIGAPDIPRTQQLSPMVCFCLGGRSGFLYWAGTHDPSLR